jgi:fatty acid-binding protein DegV
MFIFLRHRICFSALLAAFLIYSAPPAQANDPQINNRRQFTETLKKRTETVEIATRVAQLVAGGNYAEAEKTLGGLLDQKTLSNDGHRRLEKVYLQLSAMQQLRVWNKWCSARSLISHLPSGECTSLKELAF